MALAAAQRIRVGRLTVVLPDGSQRTSGTPRPPVPGRFGSTTSPSSPGSSPTVRRAPARRYRWPVVQPRPPSPASARRHEPRGVRPPAAGPSFSRNLAGRSRIARAQTTEPESPQHRCPRRPGKHFYRLFLDDSMTYPSAVFASPDQSLDDAQVKNTGSSRATRVSRRATCPGDWNGLGWVRAVCRCRHSAAACSAPPPISREQFSWRIVPASGWARAPHRRPAAATTATSRGRTTRSSRSRCSRRSAPSTSVRSSKPAIALCAPVAD